jgi:hypothetical protein
MATPDRQMALMDQARQMATFDVGKMTTVIYDRFEFDINKSSGVCNEI